MSDRNLQVHDYREGRALSGAAAWLLGVVCLLSIALPAGADAASDDVAAPVEQPVEDVAGAETKDDESEDGTTADAEAEQESFEERLDKLLADAQQEEAYGETEHCLYHRKFDEIDIINENMLLFSRGNKYWLNSLKRSCIGLERRMVINVLMSGVGSLCANDLVYANTRFDMQQGWTSSGRPLMVRATCTLGEFRSIDETYARALLALKE